MRNEIREPLILISAGDPNGVGVEIILKGIEPEQYRQFLVIGNQESFLYYQTIFNTRIPLNFIHKTDDIASQFNSQALNILHIPYANKIIPGELNQYAGEFALHCLDTAVSLIKKNIAAILVTAPINKEAIIKTTPGFIGHTEYLAQAFNIKQVTMALISSKIKLALMTTHIALNQVSAALNSNHILTTLEHCDDFLKQIGLQQGRIAVCGLNPHSGEGGHFGDEELNIITPAINQAKNAGINVFGPFPADTLFCEIYRDTYDLYLAAYHDQGLIPFKLMSFSKGVNMTLGLPFLRVSVDHGTAFNIAGKGCADPGSMKEAISWALSAQKNRKQH